MTTVTITIDSDNDALVGDNARTEVARILTKIADRIERGSDGGKAVDINGNHVGTFDVEIDDGKDQSYGEAE
jgi:hypothetical protein